MSRNQSTTSAGKKSMHPTHAPFNDCRQVFFPYSKLCLSPSAISPGCRSHTCTAFPPWHVAHTRPSVVDRDVSELAFEPIPLRCCCVRAPACAALPCLGPRLGGCAGGNGAPCSAAALPKHLYLLSSEETALPIQQAYTHMPYFFNLWCPFSLNLRSPASTSTCMSVCQLACI